MFCVLKCKFTKLFFTRVFWGFFLFVFFSELEESLLVLPFDFVIDVLKLINDWIKVRESKERERRAGSIN